ncbi:Transmembrane domain-containing protein [Orpheovirus IHUMI-LCC2]|uniref:Transmembrane domain-containing protein n=1 Tax=Orpheovirus IHUMI-LCC2 TaxID=2023057 RepID=A0A2I2L5V2_9VIRU|nr:Transmembrane domain-containing protein [Orpheovirus IHUMI-LCC2]SNW62913.1 Transmembrane domain-containing protein [Orpheovirus IHUMI-LCC2]
MNDKACQSVVKYKISDETKGLISLIYFLAAGIWVLLALWLVRIESISSYIILLGPPAIFFFSITQLDSLQYIEDEESKTLAFVQVGITVTAIIVNTLFNYTIKSDALRHNFVNAIILSIIFIIFSTLQVQSSPQYLIYIRTIKRIMYIFSVFLLIYALIIAWHGFYLVHT